jgi:protein-tyrosine-phosphatase
LTEGAARADDKKKILFVCTANICRSPMAEAMFNALAEERELGWRAQSAGVTALIDEDIAPHARRSKRSASTAKGIAQDR